MSEAEKHMAAHAVDMILLDPGLPDAEGLGAVRRAHAAAPRLDALVEHGGDQVTVMVEDDGEGFEPALVHRGDHLGLLGMRERAEALGGTLTVESTPRRGTTIVVKVPGANPHPDR